MHLPSSSSIRAFAVLTIALSAACSNDTIPLSATGQYLPLTGGTLDGGLTVEGDVSVTGNVDVATDVSVAGRLDIASSGPGAALDVPNGDAHFGRNVGIGTASPAASLHVIGAEPNSPVRIESPAPAVGFVDTEQTHSNWEVWSDGKFFIGTADRTFANRSSKITISEAGDVGIGFADPVARLHVGGTGAGGLALRVGSSGAEVEGSAFLATQSGRVGIGTTTPGAALDVVGAGRFAAEVIAPQINSGSAASDLFLANGAAQHVVIKGNGNVGIGTNDPLASLVVGDQARRWVDGAGGDLIVRDAVEASSLDTKLVTINRTATGEGLLQFRGALAKPSCNDSIRGSITYETMGGSDGAFWGCAGTTRGWVRLDTP